MAQIEDLEQLRNVLGHPHTLTQNKIYDHIFDEAADFIAASPLLFLATTSQSGATTVSPKGDAPGFVNVGDKHTLRIPERPGNKLLMSFQNILETGAVGLIFVVPNTEETLRISGHARLLDDSSLCQALAARDKAALLVTEVTVHECFFHCAKAFKRSHTWQPESWQPPRKIAFGKQIAANTAKNKLVRGAVTTAVDQAIKLDYKTNL